MNDAGKAALRWSATYGYHVFPFDHETGKGHIAYRTGDQQATDDIDTILKWWKRWPNAGVTADLRLSHYMTVDVDGKNGKPGYKSLDKWESEHGALPKETDRHKSRSEKGEHLTYVIPESYRGIEFSNKISPESYPGLDFCFQTLHLPIGLGEVINDASPVEAPAFLMDWLVSLARPSRPSTGGTAIPAGRESLSVARRAYVDGYLERAKAASIEELKADLDTGSYNSPCFRFATRIYELAMRYPESSLTESQAEDIIEEHWPPADNGNWNEANIEKTRESAYKTVTDRLAKDGPLAFPESEERPSGNEQKEAVPGRSLEVLWFSDIKDEKYDWYDRNWIPKKGGVLVAGYGGAGKSTLFAYWVNQITSGAWSGKPENCVYLVREDSKSAIVKPRLIATGADIKRVATIIVKEPDFNGNMKERAVNFRSHLAELRVTLRKINARVVFLDPGVTFLGIDEDRDSKDMQRTVLEDVLEFADQENLLFIIIKHFKKNQSGSERLSGRDRLYGSTVWFEVFRHVLSLRKIDADMKEKLELSDDDKCSALLNIEKNSYGPDSLPQRAFLLDEVVYDGESISRFVDDGERQINAKDIDSREVETEEQTEKRLGRGNKCDQWLISLLASHKGRMPRLDVRRVWEKERKGEFTFRTVERRAAILNVASEQIAGGDKNAVEWVLPLALMAKGHPINDLDR